ncbi:MAG: DUF3568 family protein [Planctomycetota bacterium]
MKWIARVLLVVMGGAGVLGGAGCTGLEPAMLGAAASGAQTAVGIFQRGKLEAVDASPIDELTRATQQTIDALGFEVYEEEIEPDRYFIEARDLQNDWIIVELSRQTDMLTAIRLNVGYFGSEPTASLVLAQILARQHPGMLTAPLRPGLPRVRPATQPVGSATAPRSATTP